MADVDVLNELFAPPGSALPDDVVVELQHILRLLDLSAQELFYKWESYVIKMGVDSVTLNLKTARDFKKDLQDALERDSRAKAHPQHSASKRPIATPKSGAGADDMLGMLDGMVSSTPAPRFTTAAKRKANDFQTPGPKAARTGLASSPSDNKARAFGLSGSRFVFEDRQNAGQTIECLNDHLHPPSAPSSAPAESRVKLKANTELPKFAYKPMAMKLSEASEILDDRIDTFTDLVQAHHRLPDAAFGNPAAQSTAEIVAVGRIAGDQPNGKLNTASLVLETSRRMGAGLRVPLKLEGPSYDFFPGKIVALRGTNVSGEYFTATELLEIPLMPPSASTPEELEVHNKRLRHDDTTDTLSPMNVIVASGPYTTDNDLSFAPLCSLLAKAEENMADVLILAGPFLDLEHPVVVSGDFEEHLPQDAQIEPDRATLNDVFRVLISQPLQRLVHAVPTITIVMVPSVRDAISRHVSWPQDRFPKQALGLPKQVQVVANPMTLSINELVFGISSQDVLSELRRDNVHQAPKGKAFNDDFLARLAGQVIEQRHFFPVFPPQSSESAGKLAAVAGETSDHDVPERHSVGANLDLGYLKLGEWVNVRPDVLILPSTLNPFAKVIDSVLCINPGTLSKARGAGTYATMSVGPRILSEEERSEGTAVAHNVFERARVDVIRI